MLTAIYFNKKKAWTRCWYRLQSLSAQAAPQPADLSNHHYNPPFPRGAGGPYPPHCQACLSMLAWSLACTSIRNGDEKKIDNSNWQALCAFCSADVRSHFRSWSPVVCFTNYFILSHANYHLHHLLSLTNIQTSILHFKILYFLHLSTMNYIAQFL